MKFQFLGTKQLLTEQIELVSPILEAGCGVLAILYARPDRRNSDSIPLSMVALGGYLMQPIVWRLDFPLRGWGRVTN